MRCAKTVPISVAHALRAATFRFRTATRASSPIRPGSTAFANSPTENAEKTSRKPGTGGGIAWGGTALHPGGRGGAATRVKPRSEEGRVGEEGRFRGGPYHLKKKKRKTHKR